MPPRVGAVPWVVLEDEVPPGVAIPVAYAPADLRQAPLDGPEVVARRWGVVLPCPQRSRMQAPERGADTAEERAP